jgi:hypothetical protein
MSFRYLGFDPAPGDVVAVRGLVSQLDRGVRGTEDALSLLDGGGDAGWQGEAAAAFRASMQDGFRPQLQDTGDGLRSSRDALNDWADELTSFQARARALEEEAAAASAASVSREASVASLRRQELAGTLTPEGEDDLALARRRAQSAQGDLDDIIARAHALRRDADGRASVAAAALSSTSVTLQRYAGSGWDQFWSGSGDFFSAVGDAFAEGFDWVMTYVAPVLEDILAIVGPIVAIAAIFIPALGPIALALAGLALLINTLQALRGEGSWQEVMIGVVGLAAGGALGALGKAAGGGTLPIANIFPQGAVPALAGGGAAAAGSASAALYINGPNIAANSFWAATKAGEMNMESTNLVDAMFGRPMSNLGERLRNTFDGRGPRTDEELAQDAHAS